MSRHLYVRRASAGSGKTFTLAAHYIALLLHGESYRSILAVTFTNKATAEMKERIIGYLYAIARHTTHRDTQGFLSRVREVYKELGFHSTNISSNEWCAQQAEQLFTAIMADYDAMRVQTIDAFLQSLLSGMVQMLGGTVGYTVELDVKTIISEAVDRLLTIGAQDPKLLKPIARYMDEQMQQEKSWDIRKGLNEIGLEIYKEYLQQEAPRLIFDDHTLAAYKEKLKWEKNAPIDELKAVLPLINLENKDAKKVLNRMEQSLNGTVDKDENMFKGFTDNELLKLEAGSPEIRMHELGTACRQAWLQEKQICTYLNDLVLMGALKEEIERELDETNSRLLATTANTLAQALQPGDADFILEKAGIRYRHIMLDEFQDTSTLQWANFSRLLQELLATENGSTLIVGDIKQSIYRWRNGNWGIMANLEQEWPYHYNDKLEPLGRNFRSEREVVRFNLDTFSLLSHAEGKDTIKIYEENYRTDNLSAYYRSGHEGGYVRMRAYAQTGDKKQGELRRQVRDRIITDMFSRIEDLLAHGIPARKMMILVRQHNEATEILNLLEQLRGKDDFPHLSGVSLISNDCFQLRFSRTVMILVSAIRYICTDDGAALAYVRLYCPNNELETRKWACRNMALTDLIEDLLQHDIVGRDDYDVNDLAYLNCFRDLMRNYVASNGSDGKAFIRYWDNKMSTKSIPSMGEDGIRIMTIHSSKGLQAENIFIPFCNWKMEEDKRSSKLWCNAPGLLTNEGDQALIPIPQNSKLKDTCFAADYEKEHILQRIDNLNLLYVAFTRAAERLFIYADVCSIYSKSSTKERATWDVGQIMAERCGMWEELTALFTDKRIGGEDDFAERCYGSMWWEQKDSPQPKTAKVTEPFSFELASTTAGECLSSSARMEFRQSQDSINYGWAIASLPDETTEMDQRAFGTLCHEVLATIATYPTPNEAAKAVRSALDRAFELGHIPTTERYNEALELLTDTVLDPQMSDWFTGSWRVQREKALLLIDEHGEMEERRMDRVMWQGDHAVVIDYKFGHDNTEYDRQVRHYMKICRQMGARSVEGYLWIAAERKRVRIDD